MKPDGITATYCQDCDEHSAGIQSLTVEITDQGAGAYVVLRTDRWALDPEDLEPFVAAIRALLAQVEAAA